MSLSGNRRCYLSPKSAGQPPRHYYICECSRRDCQCLTATYRYCPLSHQICKLTCGTQPCSPSDRLITTIYCQLRVLCTSQPTQELNSVLWWWVQSIWVGRIYISQILYILQLESISDLLKPYDEKSSASRIPTWPGTRCCLYMLGNARIMSALDITPYHNIGGSSHKRSANAASVCEDFTQGPPYRD